MNCYLDTKGEEDINCTRIRTKDSTTLLINVGKTDKRRPDQFYTEAESVCQDPEILYTVTDAIDVEQGAGGFVNRIKAMHDNIAEEQSETLRRNSARNEDLTEQLEAFLGKSSRRSFRSSQGGTPRGENRLSRTASSTGTPRDERVLSRSSSIGSSTGGEELSPKSLEFIRAESEIVYSLSDDTGVEQGCSGFVKFLKEKHEMIGGDKPPDGSASVDRTLLNSKDKPYPV